MRKVSVTIKDVAKHCGVSPMTVSFVLNDKPGEVSAAMRERVKAAAEQLGYRPNPMARALATGRSGSITLWMKTLFPPYSAQVIHHVRQQAEGSGLLVNIWDMRWPLTPENAIDPASFPHWPADGVLALEGREWADHYFAHHAPSRLPLVSLGTSCSHQGDYVQFDLNQGAQDAVRHLVKVGCRRIAYLEPQRGHQSGDVRFDAYTATVREAGLEPDYVIAPDSGRRDGWTAFDARLQANQIPDGLFCYNDEMAIGACRAVREAGLRVPDDVALVGCDGIEETEYQSPALSTIVLPMEEMCRLAWQFLRRRLAEPDLPPQQILLPTSLIVRDSSRV
jgi:DNA-binding LacI/PurR family transcriptional regulator